MKLKDTTPYKPGKSCSLFGKVENPVVWKILERLQKRYENPRKTTEKIRKVSLYPLRCTPYPEKSLPVPLRGIGVQVFSFTEKKPFPYPFGVQRKG